MDKTNHSKQTLINEVNELQDLFSRFSGGSVNPETFGMEKREKYFESAQYCNQIINCLQEGIIVLDRNLKYRTWNAYMEQHFGFTTAEIIGKSPIEFFPFLEKYGVRERAQGTLDGFLFEAIEIPYYLSQNGKSGWITLAFAPLRNITGDIIGVICTIHDITDKKQQEEALKKEEENFRTLLELAPDAFLRIKQDGDIIFVNNSTVAATGYTKEEIAGMNIRQLLSEKSKRENPLQFDALESGDTIKVERELARKDGSVFIAEMNSRQMPDKTFQSLIRDITERKKLQQELEENENLYRTLFKLSPSGIMLEDLSGNIIDFNEAYRESTGYLREELLGKNVRLLVYPELYKAVERNIADLKAGKISEHDITTLRKDGTTRQIELKEALITLGSGKKGIIVVTNDITKRKAAEQSLRESEEKLRDIFNMMLDGVYKSTHQGRFIEVNPALVKMLGYNSKEELLNIDIKKELYFDEEDRDSAVLEENLEEMAVFRLKKKDGSAIWVEDHGHLILDEDGNVAFHEGIMRDVTERVIAQNRLEEYARELRESNQIKDKFFSIVSHDLRSPFQGLLAASKILASEIDKLTKEEVTVLARELNLSIRRQYEFLTDLLDWSKLQRKNSIINPETVFLRKELERVLEPLQLLASQKNIEIRNAVGSCTTVFADLNMLKLVLRNLVANGIKFTNPHGVVVVSAIEKGDLVDIAVSDNGIGIRKEKLGLIFNKDTLYTTEGTANETGTGLGLMLCKEIIEKHGSEIVVESEEAKGSKISFALRRIDPD